MNRKKCCTCENLYSLDCSANLKRSQRWFPREQEIGAENFSLRSEFFNTYVAFSIFIILLKFQGFFFDKV